MKRSKDKSVKREGSSGESRQAGNFEAGIRLRRARGLRRNEPERHPVVAPTLAGRRRAIVEKVAVMPAAADAMVLRARQNQLEVLFSAQMTGNVGEEAWPAGAAVELHLRGEKR